MINESLVVLRDYDLAKSLKVYTEGPFLSMAYGTVLTSNPPQGQGIVEAVQGSG